MPRDFEDEREERAARPKVTPEARVKDRGAAFDDLQTKINNATGARGVAQAPGANPADPGRGRQPHAPLGGIGTRATGGQTRGALANIRMNAQSALHLGQVTRNVDLLDEISDAQAARNAAHEGAVDQPVLNGYRRQPALPNPNEPVQIQHLPAVINREVARQAEVSPQWHAVKHLPAYLQRAIRALGRQVFHMYTTADLEEVQVLANLNGAGPNSPKELRAFVGTVNKIGTKIAVGEFDFQRSMPGYKADVALFEALGMQFLVVQDHQGQYTYAWPVQNAIHRPVAAARARGNEQLAQGPKALSRSDRVQDDEEFVL